MVLEVPVYSTKLHHPMSRDYGNNYDPKLVDCVYEEIECSIFDIFFLIEFLPFYPHNPILDCLDQLFDIHSLKQTYKK